MSSRFSDRFLPGTYAEDQPVCLTLSTDSRSDRRTVQLPESLFVRAQCIGRGYNLHLLPAIDVYAETSLNKLQLETLLQEVRFVLAVVQDDLLSVHLRAVEDMLATGVNCAGPAAVLIEGP